MIAFVEERRPKLDFAEEGLRKSMAQSAWNQATKPLRLEARLADLLDIPDEKAVVAVANGALALHGLVQFASYRAGRPLRWIVSAFTFLCQRQGPLGEARVVDCDETGFLDLDAVKELDPTSYDGIIVTNLFGCASRVEEWEALAERHGKTLLFDSATCVYSTYNGVPIGRFGDGEAFSFHHTKPLGMGEGGAVVVPVEQEEEFRSLISCGLYKHIDTGPYSLDAKMSDIAAVFIIARLQEAKRVREGYRDQHERLAAIGRELGYSLLVTPEDPFGLPSLVPLLGDRSVSSEELVNPVLALQKYYRPLDASCERAQDLYERIICVPCHRDVARVSDGELASLLGRLV